MSARSKQATAKSRENEITEIYLPLLTKVIFTIESGNIGLKETRCMLFILVPTPTR